LTRVSTYKALIYSTNYTPFGVVLQEREFSSSAYRFGFNGKENLNLISGTSNIQDYGLRLNNTRLGRFFSVDPIHDKYPELSVYQFSSNTPIWAIDLDGAEAWKTSRQWYYSDFVQYSQTVQTKIEEYKSKGIKFDCADLAFELLIEYAAKNGLPLTLKTEASTISNEDKNFVPNPNNPDNSFEIKEGDVAQFKKLVKNYAGANALEKNSYKVDRKNAVAGDMYILGQKGNFWHVVIILDPNDPKSKQAIVQGNIPEEEPKYMQDWVYMSYKNDKTMTAAGAPGEFVSRFLIFQDIIANAQKQGENMINEAAGVPSQSTPGPGPTPTKAMGGN